MDKVTVLRNVMPTEQGHIKINVSLQLGTSVQAVRLPQVNPIMYCMCVYSCTQLNRHVCLFCFTTPSENTCYKWITTTVIGTSLQGLLSVCGYEQETWHGVCMNLYGSSPTLRCSGPHPEHAQWCHLKH